MLFSFTIYEKLLKPQTMFYHPAHDMIYATNVNDYIYPLLFTRGKTKSDSFCFKLFTSYGS